MKTKLALLSIVILALWTGQIKAQNQISWMQFSKDNYGPGTFDDQGNYLNGTELMRLTSYKGKLYAATSVFKDSFAIATYPQYNGCQVLRKDSSTAPWRVDKSFGTRYLRTDALEKIVFTHDSLGNPLPKSVEMLVAGIWDIGVGNPKQRNISIAVRDDISNNWTISNVISVPPSDNGFASVRSMAVHKDYITGAQYLIIGAANGGIFKGVYDLSVPGNIKWVGGNEVNPQFGRPQSMAVYNDTLFASFDYGGITVSNQTGGLFKRIDGPNPTWQQVYTFYNPAFPSYNQTLRGITTVPSITNPGQYDIVGAIENPPLPVVVTFQPYNNYQIVYEVNYVNYFTNVFGSAPVFDNNLAGAALNKLELFVNPYNNEMGYFITTNVRHPLNPAAGYNGAYFMCRKNDGSFDWGYIQPDSSLPSSQELRGVRTIEKSPFSNEPNVYYFGGFTAGTLFVKNTAWIYKGTIQNPLSIDEAVLKNKILIYPNPAGSFINIMNSGKEWLSYDLFNSIGQVLKSGVIKSENASINISNLPTGIYHLSIVNTDNKKRITKKIIKRK
jgi:hypothetical protein